MQPLFVFCADLHLEDGAWTTRPGIYGDAYYSFNQIIDYCIEHHLPLILGGDVLERKQNLARPVAKLCAGMARMQRENLRVYYIQGNHEYDRNAPWLSVHPWPIHLHDSGVFFDDVNVWGLDWLPRGEIQAAFNEVPDDVDVLVTHQVWTDLMGDIGRTECALTDVRHVQTVIAGDYHVTRTVEGTNADGKPIRLLSPGSTCMQDISESAEKFFFVIAKSAAGLEFVPQPLRTRPFRKYVIQTQEQLDEFCAGQFLRDLAEIEDNTLPEEIRKPLVRVRFNKDLPDAFLRITTAGANLAHMFCDVITERQESGPKPARRDSTKNDLLQALADVLGDDTDAYKLAQEILHADNPKRAVEEHFHSYVKEAVNATSEIGSSELGTPPEEDV